MTHIYQKTMEKREEIYSLKKKREKKYSVEKKEIKKYSVKKKRERKERKNILRKEF